MSLPLGTAMGPLSGFCIAWAERQSQTEPDPSILSSVLWFSHGRSNLGRPPCATRCVVPLCHWAGCARGSTLVFDTGPRQM